MDAVLSAFLSSDLNVEETVQIKRLGVDLTFKAIDGKTLAKLQQQATHYSGTGANRTAELDEHKFGSLAIAHSCASINFGDPKMLEKFNASDAGDCVQKSLLAGEIASFTQVVMRISGFEDIQKQVEDAKN